MKRVLLPILFILFLNDFKAVGQNVDTMGYARDTTVRRYFVLEARRNRFPSIFVPILFLNFSMSTYIEDGNRILVKDTASRRLRGKLKVINDTLFRVRNSTTGRTDTFNVKSVTWVRKPSIGGMVMNTLYMGLSIPVFIACSEMIKAKRTQPAIFNGVGGTFIVAVGAASLNGPLYSNRLYKYRLVKTKGYKLKKKYIYSL